MKISLRYAYVVIFLLGMSYEGTAQNRDSEGINTITKEPDGTVLLDDFEKYPVGSIPEEWYNQKGTARPATYGQDEKSEYKWAVEEENGNKYLEYDGIDAKHLNFPLVNKNVNIHKTPILSWKWRIWDIPKGANEGDENDVAGSIYVVFDLGHVLFKKVPKSIRYTWSSTLQKGQGLSKLFGNQKIIVVGSGNAERGQWQTFNRNIVEDYKRLFGDDPPKTPLAILILSDGDDTGHTVKADYDDIMLKPAHE